MTVNLENFQQLSIVLSVHGHVPTMLTLEFLKGSGVVPPDWELARPSVFSGQSSRILFKNGLDIVGQPGKVTFSESIGKKLLDDLSVANVAQRYAAALPSLDYRGVGINPKRFVTFEQQEDAHRYVTERILQRGPWQSYGTAPIQAGVNLVYMLERCQLRLAISEARLKADEQEQPAVLFGGNFHYSLVSEAVEDRLQKLGLVIGNWCSDYESFQSLIEQKFSAMAVAA